MTPVSITATTILAAPSVDVHQTVVTDNADGVADELGCRYHWPSQVPLASEPATKCGSFGGSVGNAWMKRQPSTSAYSMPGSALSLPRMRCISCCVGV